MKNNGISLHISRKRTLFAMFFFGIAVFLLFFVAVLSLYKDCGNLDTLLKSEYEYSVTMMKSDYPDSYILLNAGITFSVPKENEKSLNASIIMQSPESEYTEMVYWNSEPLEAYEVAITKSLANRHGIGKGDKLLSKHIVSDEQIEYHVKMILPELTDVRINDNGSSSDGVIIMGFDGKYVENISHSFVVFTDRNMTDLTKGILDDIPIEPVYRSDEILAVNKRIIPYVVLYVFLAFLLSAGQFFYFWKDTRYNFKRYVMLGYEKTTVNKAISRASFLMILLTILMALITLLIALACGSICAICIVVILFILLGFLLSTFIFVHVMKHIVWRT